MEIELTPSAERDLEALDAPIRERIIQKLTWFVQTDDPLVFAQSLVDHAFGDYRFRIGDWRAIVRVRRNRLIVVRIGNRRDVYR